jgi:hypothetical protein
MGRKCVQNLFVCHEVDCVPVLLGARHVIFAPAIHVHASRTVLGPALHARKGRRDLPSMGIPGIILNFILASGRRPTHDTGNSAARDPLRSGPRHSAWSARRFRPR